MFRKHSIFLSQCIKFYVTFLLDMSYITLHISIPIQDNLVATNEHDNPMYVERILLLTESKSVMYIIVVHFITLHNVWDLQFNLTLSKKHHDGASYLAIQLFFKYLLCNKLLSIILDYISSFRTIKNHVFSMHYIMTMQITLQVELLV